MTFSSESDAIRLPSIRPAVRFPGRQRAALPPNRVENRFGLLPYLATCPPPPRITFLAAVLSSVNARLLHMTVHTRRKLVIVGDGACGKTCLLITFKMGELPDEEFLPATCDNFLVDVEVDGNYIELGLFDTVGQQEYDRFRPLSYSNSDIVLICYSISHPDSLESIVEKWVPEVFHFLSDRKVPFIVVGMKKDLRVHQPTLEALARHGQRPVTEAQGREVAERVGAIVYLECSAKTGEGVRVVFEHATRAALVRNKSKKRTGCLIV